MEDEIPVLKNVLKLRLILIKLFNFGLALRLITVSFNHKRRLIYV